MRRHEADCPVCHGRGDAERRFDERLTAGIVAGLEPGDAAALVRNAMPARAAPPRRGRWLLLRLASGLGVAAGLLLAFAWYACIGPFECPYLLAVEESRAALPATGRSTALDRLASRVHAPERVLELRRADGVEPLHVALMDTDVPAVRAQYTGGDAPFTVVWSDAMGTTPTWRRAVQRDGETWWVAPRGHVTLVAFWDDRTDALCTVVAALPEPDVYRVARALRHGR
jgi:hypothetical protein